MQFANNNILLRCFPAIACSSSFPRRSIVPLLFLVALPSFAGTISLDISVTVEKRELDIGLHVLVANGGDDSAYRVQPSARIADVEFQFEPAAIGPGKRRIFRARREVPAIAAMKHGEYPVPVTVAYQDSEGARFHAPAYGILRTADEARPPSFTIQADPVELHKRAMLKVSVQSVGDDENQSVTLTPHTTPDVGIAPRSMSVEISAGRSAEVEFELRNLSAFAGSAMPLLLFLEAESAEEHGALVHEVPLTITGDSNIGVAGAEPIFNLRLTVSLAVILVIMAGASTFWILRKAKIRMKN